MILLQKSLDSLLSDQQNEEAERCSIVRVIDNEVYIFNHRVYNSMELPVDYAADKVLFFFNDGQRDSLNQDPGAAKGDYRTLELPLNIAFEIFHCFKELAQENAGRISSLF